MKVVALDLSVFAGYGFNGKKVIPYIGVGMQINLLTWGKR